MKYCQGPKCHEYKTKDRIRGTKGSQVLCNKKKITNVLWQWKFLLSNLGCYDWIKRNTLSDQALDHFGQN